jgi:ketosteroid isomerase-like protein
VAAPYDRDARVAQVADVVRRVTRALSTRDAEMVAGLLTDDVVYHFPGSNPMSGTYRGRDEVMAFFRRFPTRLDGPPTIETHDVLASEAHGADLSQLVAERGGRRHTWRTVRIYHLAEDRISEVFVTIEDQAAFDAFLSD